MNVATQYALVDVTLGNLRGHYAKLLNPGQNASSVGRSILNRAIQDFNRRNHIQTGTGALTRSPQFNIHSNPILENNLPAGTVIFR